MVDAHLVAKGLEGAPRLLATRSVSGRSGSSQVWRLFGAGGEPQQVTHLPLDVNTFVLSPNGKQIS